MSEAERLQKRVEDWVKNDSPERLRARVERWCGKSKPTAEAAGERSKE